MESLIVSLVTIIVLVQCTTGDNNTEMAMDMLKKYQYMGDNHPDPTMRGDEMFTEALANFQRFAGMNDTGELDNETMSKLTAPRCGLPDIADKGSLMRRRRKRYALTGARWSGVIGYNFKSYPQSSSITPYAIRTQIKLALNEWKKHTARLEFEESSGASDLEISFERGDHGDGMPLDGSGKTLAHAFYPSRNRIGGDVHFDDDETWAIRSDKGVDLYFVALHELGHSLGLQHSEVKEATMHPYYPGYIPDPALSEDDIMGIQAIYGSISKATIYPEAFPTDDTIKWKELFCEKGTVDATGTLNGIVFVFQGDLYAVLDESGIRSGYPRRIQEDWMLLPGDLDSALGLDKYNELLLFKAGHYWRYTWDTNNSPVLVDGYPRSIKLDFTKGLPSNIDAAFQWSDNGRTYVINDGGYSRVRDNVIVTKRKIKAKCDRTYYNYPKDLASNWNIHYDVSDILMYHGRTFFFTGDKYLRYNDNKYQPDTDYPKSTAESWFGCKLSGDRDPAMEMVMMSKQTQFAQIQTMSEPKYASGTSSATVTSLGMVIAMVATLLHPYWH